MSRRGETDKWEKRGADPRTRGVTERRPAGWQRALRWIAWLAFLGLAIWNSQKVSFGGMEFLALAVAIGISIWCMAKPLGPRKVEITKPEHVRGTFVSRTSWALVLIGTFLTIGGIGATGAIAYDLSTGRATVGDVLKDMAIFAEGWFVEIFTKGAVDAELEKTHAYALCFLLIPGLIMLVINTAPFRHRGSEFRVEPDGSVAASRGGTWVPLLEYEYVTVTGDGATITFAPPDGQGQKVVLPQARVFNRELSARLRSEVSADFFRDRLGNRGFAIEEYGSKSGFIARRR